MFRRGEIGQRWLFAEVAPNRGQQRETIGARQHQPAAIGAGQPKLGLIPGIGLQRDKADAALMHACHGKHVAVIPAIGMLISKTSQPDAW
ncbi:hypothetical protein [Thiorhodovibrio litoralis]|uniref:hypothetical protein n=1 Tax=Thiorhodovibrio litoralis TaxID=2952932 RepID=UPI002B259AEC|nr:hypothetical protein [Thiorhodovibrio litoralis]